MKVYKVEMLIIDHDELGEQEITDVLENTRYPNHCIAPTVMKTIEADIGEWDDDHPLNNTNACKSEYEKVFPS